MATIIMLPQEGALKWALIWSSGFEGARTLLCLLVAAYFTIIYCRRSACPHYELALDRKDKLLIHITGQEKQCEVGHARG
jgi:hypothetical protein